MGRTHTAIAAILAVLAAASTAHAAPLITGLGGPAGFGTNNLPANDDGSTSEIDVRLAFPDGLFFFGTGFTSLYLNNNGNISFGGSLGTFTPSPFPIASQRMIAPWWGDVDTRGGGTPGRNGVYWSITPGRFVATWHNVGYFSSHDDLLNDFQLILTAAGPGIGDFDVEFRYNRCEWTTGDASGGSGGFGGTPAQAGFDAGNLVDYIALPGSLTRDVLALCTTSNVRMAGVWRFEIRGGEVMCPGRGESCETGRVGVCGPGTRVCISPEASECRPNREPSAEVCNGLDDNCDGTTDEALGTTTCGVGICVLTVENCVGGVPRTCVPGPPSIEACNLLDDDCNGVTDDMPDQFCGIGSCVASAPGCIEGRVPACVPLPPAIEECNGYDDDCNGLADDTLDACFAIPDAGPPDAGRPIDGSIDAPACIGYGCDPYRLQGRAGPIGCGCRVGQSAPMRGPMALVALALGLALMRRRLFCRRWASDRA